MFSINQSYKRFTVLVLLSVVLIISACTATKKERDPNLEPVDNIPQEPVAIIKPPVETKVFYTKPVVKKLLKRAQMKFNQKDYHSTVNLLEQAIDISPNNPVVWQRLALVRLKQRNYMQAEQLAIKSNVLGEANDELRMKNWQIIAEAKRGRANP